MSRLKVKQVQLVKTIPWHLAMRRRQFTCALSVPDVISVPDVKGSWTDGCLGTVLPRLRQRSWAVAWTISDV